MATAAIMAAYQMRRQSTKQIADAKDTLPGGHKMAALMAVCAGAIMMCAQRMKQRCFDSNRFDCSQPLAELLAMGEIQDSLSYFRSLLLQQPFISYLLHVRFVLTACLHVASTVTLMLMFCLHPSRFDPSVMVRVPHVESAPCEGRSRSHDRWLTARARPRALCASEPTSPELTQCDRNPRRRLMMQHIIPCVGVLTVIYLTERERLRFFAAMHDPAHDPETAETAVTARRPKHVVPNSPDEIYAVTLDNLDGLAPSLCDEACLGKAHNAAFRTHFLPQPAPQLKGMLPRRVVFSR